ncbi:methyl-accepting chemotaxis protein [Shewanella dokdonensis]|uniref:Methyl-accepting chemotaxis protein n=1 Tax=Shewanella dokdonensis TaxID=712036 RepID=A0ABX8DG12_9GAMM|nr:methyl-accepting chemotaxis protein [Shewanella dokdonensis]
MSVASACWAAWQLLLNSNLLLQLLGGLLLLPVLALLYWLKTQVNFIDDAESKDNAASAEQQALHRIATDASRIAIGGAEVSHFVDGLQQNIQGSGEAASQIAVAANQLSATTVSLSEHAEAVLQQAEQSRQLSLEGRQYAVSGLDAIRTLSQDIDSAARKVEQLQQQADAIGKITEVIDGVAAQTNLLALNAAIEAARAGEAGRGFAVVADEVRTLAAKTADATQDIGRMLSQIRQDTEQTSSLMGTVVGRTAETVNAISALEQRFDGIAGGVQQSTQALAQIETALREYRDTTSEISEAIVRISDSLEETGHRSEQISQQAFEFSKTTEGIFLALNHWNIGTFEQQVLAEAQQAATACGQLLEQGLQQGTFTEQQLFSPQYQRIGEIEPAKYSTAFDSYTDQYFPAVQEPILSRHSQIIYAGAVDHNGYFPTHNQRFSKPLTGDSGKDTVNNRTKRLFNDATGIRCGRHTDPMLLQTYKRDTGEVMHDLSVPVFVNGRHWGGFRIGFRAN